jgi:hypothetical protein
MKLVVMQPYFLPYLGYFDLLNITDEWVVFDTSQYVKCGWMNRNRVLHPTSGWVYVTASLKRHVFPIRLNEVETSESVDWAGKILKQLGHYHSDAPFYDEVIQVLKECFSGPVHSLAAVNTALFRGVARRLGIERPIHVYSEMGLDYYRPGISPADFGVAMARAMGATEFINRPGGAAFLSREAFARSGITLTFQSFRAMTYPCGRYRFEPDLSIVDVMMWNSPARIKRYLDTWRTEFPSGAEAARTL